MLLGGVGLTYASHQLVGAPGTNLFSIFGPRIPFRFNFRFIERVIFLR